jgi:O-methyltransferase
MAIHALHRLANSVINRVRVVDPMTRLPIEATESDIAIIRSVMPFTMTTPERVWALIKSVDYIMSNDIAGAFVECGVWRGGSAMAIASQLRRRDGEDREIWLYDTFAGMSTPTSVDREISTGRSAQKLMADTPIGDGNNVWARATLADVTANLKTTGFPQHRIRLVEGDVSETLLQHRPDAISLLRLDTDWYESTRDELASLYQLLSPGGVCILDDYGHWDGARRAFDEFAQANGISPLMLPIDSSGRVFVKC